MTEKAFSHEPNIYEAVTRTVASGKSGRGVSWLCEAEYWRRAMDCIVNANKIALISGFYVPAVDAPETDGPPGTLVLARALARYGFDVRVWSDSLCMRPFLACAEVLNFPTERIVDIAGESGIQAHETFSPDLYIYIERLGRAADGRYYNMRSEDISRWTAPLDRFAMERGISSIGIGDGGNEVGMGAFKEQLSRSMPGYEKCLCAVETDVCLPVDVSNWGAYALAALLSYETGCRLAQNEEEERAMFDAMCACGTVDGVTKRCEPCADGFDINEQLEILNELRNICCSEEIVGSNDMR